jgi:acyl-CoA reductase-like NAD-dependent aldehyde dehydrogenase
LQDVNLAFRAMVELDNGITYINASHHRCRGTAFGGVKQRGTGIARQLE